LKSGITAKSTIPALLLTVILVAVSIGNGLAQKYLPSTDFVKAAVVPEPIKLEWKIRESLTLNATTVIVVSTNSSQQERDIAVWVKQGMYHWYGINPEIIVTDLVPEQNAIIMGVAESNPVFKDFVPSLSTQNFGNLREQGYVLSVSPRRAFLIGLGIPGLKYGAQTLLQLISMDSYIVQYVVPPVEIADFPAFDMRALLLPLRDYRVLAQTFDARALIDVAEMMHMNTVIIQVDNAIKFDSVRGVARSGALEKDTLRAVVKYAREAGLEVIPFVNTFSHQDVLLCPTYPNLCLDKRTYDPSNPKVYPKLFAIIDEILEIFEPKYMHIGHDEIRAFASMPKEKAAELFLRDIRKIHAHLKEKNVQMMMWASMLLNAAQFPGQDNCNGALGSTYALIDSLPKDIILVDTHYRQRNADFPTVDYLLSKGFRVMGCVYNDPKVANNFSKYAAGKDGKFLGMTAALWGCFDYVGTGTPRKNIRETAGAFWRAGIPAKDPTGQDIPASLR
jgi:hexosaminidase